MKTTSIALNEEDKKILDKLRAKLGDLPTIGLIRIAIRKLAESEGIRDF